MATEPDDEMGLEPAEPEEAEPASDFDIAADAAFAATTPKEYRVALKEAVMACMETDYSEKEKPSKSGGALDNIFGKA